MKKDIPYDLLEPYLQGSLNEMERSDFEERMKNDPEFQEQLDLYGMIREANRDERFADFEKKLQNAERVFVEKSQNIQAIQKRQLWFKSMAAVVALLFIVFFGNKYWDSTPSDPEGIYTKYAQHDFSFHEKSEDNELVEIENLLNSDQFAEVLPLIENFLQDFPERADMQLAKGIALLESGKTNDALDIFTRLGTQHPLYYNESLWYSSLAYIKQGLIQESQARLKQIPADAGRYQESQELIQELKKISK